MGTVIEYHQVQDEETQMSRLLVYFTMLKKMTEPQSIGKGDDMVDSRTDFHGDGSCRYGVLSMVDVFLLKEGRFMGIVIGILILAVILWWPRKKGE